MPILFDNDFFTKLGEKETELSLYELSYLLIYKDKSNKIHTEWIITIPDNESLNNKKTESTEFYGIVYILDWFGTFTEAYQVKRNGDIYSTKDFSISYEQTPSIKVNGYYLECETVAWYSCVSAQQGISGPYLIKTLSSCHYDYSVTTCSWGYEPPSSEYIIRTGDNYKSAFDNGTYNSGSGAAGGGGSGEGGRNEIADDIIKTDVINDFKNPDADCIYKNLTNNATFNGLIAQFKNNKNLNLTFQNGNPVDSYGNPVAGQTHHDPGTTNFCITISNTLLNGYGGIDIAKTFLHEAWHANIWLTAEKWYPNGLPSGFQNLSLVEQLKCLDKIGGKETFQHYYMAENIEKMVTGLQEYVETNFPDIYNNPANDYNAYKDLCMQGLQGTSVFEEYERQLNGMKIGTLSRSLTTERKCP